MNNLKDPLVQSQADEAERLVPTVPMHTLEAPLKLQTHKTTQNNCTGADVVLCSIYILLCTMALIATFLPVGPVRIAQIQSGDTISAGLVLDGLLSNQTKPSIDNCAFPYNSVCGGMTEDGLLKQHQMRLLQTLEKRIDALSLDDPARKLFEVCTSAKSVTRNVSAFEEWSRGASAHGISIESAANPFSKTPLEKHLFVTSDLARRGPKATGPYDVLSAVDCPFGFEPLEEFALQEPVVQPYLLKDIYTDNATAVCNALSSFSFVPRGDLYLLEKRNGIMARSTCAHLVGELFPNKLATSFNGTTQDFKSLGKTFDRVVQALQKTFECNKRAISKLQAIKLYNWPSVYKNPELPDRSVDDNTDWWQWHAEQQRKQWRVTMALPYEPDPAMMPWEVNAFYNPSVNRVFVPPGLLSICPKGASAPFWAGTITFIIAHEVSHSLDPMCIHFDGSGVYNPIVQKALKPSGYDALSNCLERNAKKRGIHPFQTLSESFADAVGWHATKATLESATPWPIEALGLQSNVFAAKAMLARTWCTNPLNLQTARLNYSVWHDEHPPANFRVDNTLASNSDAPCASPYLESCLLFLKAKAS